MLQTYLRLVIILIVQDMAIITIMIISVSLFIYIFSPPFVMGFCSSVGGCPLTSQTKRARLMAVVRRCFLKNVYL